MTRSRSIALVLATGALAVSAAGCGGGGKASAGSGAKASGTPSGQGSSGIAVTDDPSLVAKGRPIPAIKPQQVQGLVGKWVNSGPIGDYFVFKADGTGTWITKGRALWSGKVIPAGKGAYRLSWKDQDTDTSYWAIKLQQDGKLLFEGNQQTYTRTKS